MFRNALLTTAILISGATASAHSAEPVREQRVEYHYVLSAEGLLHDFDAARATRDYRALRQIDYRAVQALSRAVSQERRESSFDARPDRHDRLDRRELARFRELLGRYQRLERRLDRAALDLKRDVLADFVTVSRRDAHGDAVAHRR
jgi:hypothetical protein